MKRFSYIIQWVVYCCFLCKPAFGLELSDTIGKIGSLTESKCFRTNAGQWPSSCLFRNYGNNRLFSLYTDHFSFGYRTQAQTLNRYLVYEICPIRTDVAEIVPSQAISQNINYINNDLSTSRRIDSYRKISYNNIYKGVDFIFSFTQQGDLKYDIVVAPYTRIEQIKLKYNGVDSLSVDSIGNLIVHTVFGSFKESVPYSYQIENGLKNEVFVQYSILENVLSFKIVGEYDTSSQLVIDPIFLENSTYFYANKQPNTAIDLKTTLISSMEIDDNNFVWIAGQTTEYFPDTYGVYDSSFNGYTDGFIGKLSPDMDSIIFFTYIGGSSGESITEIALTRTGEVAVCGFTGSSDFPVSADAFDTTGPINSNKSFFMLLTADVSKLIHSSFLGGNNGGENTIVSAMSVKLNRLFIAGRTLSSDFPVSSNASQLKYGGSLTNDYGDGFFCAFTLDSGKLVYSSYIGGYGDDIVTDIRVNKLGQVVLTGRTSSPNFYITNSSSKYFNKSLKGPYDGFVLKLDTNYSRIVFSHLLGGSDYDQFSCVFLDANEDLFLTGTTYSKDFPTSDGVFQSSLKGGSDIIALKLRNNGLLVEYSTYLGGADLDGFQVFGPSNCMTNRKGELYVVGNTYSTDFPVTKDAFIPKNYSALRLPYPTYSRHGNSVFIAKLSHNGSELIYGSYWGGLFFDALNTSVLTDDGCSSTLFISGKTESFDLPVTKGAFRDTAYLLSLRDSAIYNPPCNTCQTAFISKFIDTLSLDSVNLSENFGNSDTIVVCDYVYIPIDIKNYGASITWSRGLTGSRVILRDTGWYKVSATYGCDTVHDSIYVVMHYNPKPELGKDSLFCDHFYPLDLDAGFDNLVASYLWNTGSTNRKLQISQPGKYSVKVKTTFCGEASDTVELLLNETPDISDYDTVICNLQSLSLDAGYSPQTMTYRWSGGETSKQINVSDTGVYQLFLTSACGYDSAQISVGSQFIPQAELPPDTTLCDSVDLLFTVGRRNNGERYLWSDPAKLIEFGNSDSLRLKIPANILLNISNSCGSDSDIISVYLNRTPSYRIDTILIACDSVDQIIGLDPDIGTNYVWHSGITESKIHALEPGTYTLSVENACGSENLKWDIKLKSAPLIHLPKDTNLCDIPKYILNAEIDDSSATYLWQDGSTSSQYEVQVTGTYRVTVSNNCGDLSDTSIVRLLTKPHAELGLDTVFCDQLNILLKTVGDSSNEESYLWSDGSTENTNYLDSIGFHWVQISNICGIDTDTIQLFLVPGPKVNIGEDTLVCGEFFMTLDAGNVGSQYLWQPGGENSQRLDVIQPGNYSVQVIGDFGCTTLDEIKIIEDCRKLFFIPNSFSPNNDGLNDVFKPVVLNYDWYLTVYSLTGQLVFKGSENQGWNGYLNGQRSTSTVFYFHVDFVNGVDKKQVRGSVQLIY